jgi:hypothetical protein
MSLFLIKRNGMERYRGVEIQLHEFLTSTLKRRNGQFHSPAAFTPWKKPHYPVDRRLSGPQSRSGRGDEKWFCFCRESNL